MKNKVFSLLAVVLFMGSSLVVNANEQNEDLDQGTCFDVATEAEAGYMNLMANLLHTILSNENSFAVFASAYDACNAAGGQ